MNARYRHITGLYVHVPFCDGKCFYCAFYSRPCAPGLVARYLKALELELRQYPDLAPETIYFGGGTPTILSLPELQELCQIVKMNVSAAALKEWTVETNPGSLTEAKLAFLAGSGVNRISLGAQSFDDRVLQWLGRRHSSAAIPAAAGLIEAAGFSNFNLDLIACVPGFEPAVWRATLQAAVALNPSHISVYALTSEEGSRLGQQLSLGRARRPRPERGRRACRADVSGAAYPEGAPYLNKTPSSQFNLLSEDEEIEALELAENILSTAGYSRYEISNYAKPGRECRHNLACWRGGEYIGLGPAASSHVGLERRTNEPDLPAWLDALEHGRPPPSARDLRSASLKQVETVVFGLRMAEGVSEAVAESCRSALLTLQKDGLVELAKGRWRLTKRGLNLADFVGAEILAGAD